MRCESRQLGQGWRALQTLPALLLMLAQTLLLSGCNVMAPASFTVAWSFDTNGQIEPCGCSAHQLGGLARRASLLKILREERPVLALEGPHLFDAEGGFHLFKGFTIIKALNVMKYDAAMLGVSEAQQGESGLRKLDELAEFPLFSANLTVGGQPWLQPLVTMRLASTDIGITGVSQPQRAGSATASGTGFADPHAGLSAALKTMEKDADFTIVCLEGDTAWVAEMTARYAKQVDLFLAGDRSLDAHELALKAADQQATGKSSDSSFELPNLAFQEEPALLNTWGLGRYLGQVEVRRRGQLFTLRGSNHSLDDTLPLAAEIQQLLATDYRPQLGQYVAELLPDITQPYIAPSMCSGCHPDAYDTYMSSAHSHSLATLEAEGQAYNPDCLLCHAIYDAEKDQLQPMTCLYCHSNITWEHEWQAVEGIASPPAEPVVRHDYGWCVRCHDPINSLPFASHWPQYVNRIYHGGDCSAAERAAKDLGLKISDPPPDLTGMPDTERVAESPAQP